MSQCQHPPGKQRTVYRGPLGCVEQCEACGEARTYDADGTLTRPGFMTVRLGDNFDGDCQRERDRDATRRWELDTGGGTL